MFNNPKSRHLSAQVCLTALQSINWKKISRKGEKSYFSSIALAKYCRRHHQLIYLDWSHNSTRCTVELYLHTFLRMNKLSPREVLFFPCFRIFRSWVSIYALKTSWPRREEAGKRTDLCGPGVIWPEDQMIHSHLNHYKAWTQYRKIIYHLLSTILGTWIWCKQNRHKSPPQ